MEELTPDQASEWPDGLHHATPLEGNTLRFAARNRDGLPVVLIWFNSRGWTIVHCFYRNNLGPGPELEALPIQGDGTWFHQDDPRIQDASIDAWRIAGR